MKLSKKFFTICFTMLLSEIVQWYGLPQPLYRQHYKAKGKKYKSIVEFTIENNGTPVKVCSKMHKSIARATKDAAKQAVQKLQQQHNFNVHDINYEICMHQRQKRRLLEIKLAAEELSFCDLKRSYFQVCDENIN
ncbi:Glutamate--tRNA ligase 2 [Bienertia sinuspersici]